VFTQSRTYSELPIFFFETKKKNVNLSEKGKDYSTGGMLLVGRTWSATGENYAFGFNGKLNTDEVYGNDNAVDFGNRIYNPRLMLWLSVDKLTNKFPSWSPYVYSLDNPIKFKDENGDAPGDPTLGFLINFKAFLSVTDISFNLSATTSLSYDLKYFQPTVDASISLYNGGLGTSLLASGIQYDITAAAHITAGGEKGQGSNMPIYTLNANTRSAVDNTFRHSVTMGQLVTYNSATDGITRQGLFGFRTPNFSVSSNNDTDFPPYFGQRNNTPDQGFTGGIMASTYIGNTLLEFGYQSFTGIPDRGRDPIKGENGKSYYAQDAYQKSLNKAFTSFRVGGGAGSSPSLSLELNLATDGWLQNGLHNLTNNAFFDYTKESKSTNTSTGAGIKLN
jgi:RHS repeat-associated protein